MVSIRLVRVFPFSFLSLFCSIIRHKTAIQGLLVQEHGLFITEQYAVWFSLEFCAWNNVQSQILLNIMIKHILNYILCPQLVVKTKYICTLIKLLLIYLITYFLLTSSGQGRQLVHGFANQVQRQKAFCHKAYGF